MRLSLDWLREFVDFSADPSELRAALIGAGIGVETVINLAGDVVFDLEVTTNRPDCLSHYGIAREVATVYHKPLKALSITVKESTPPASAADAVSIEIADPDLCARYCGRVVRGVQVKPSPEWLSKRLEAVGVRSINNVADATNYVLMELGHPLHAFDLPRLGGHKIVVRRARPGERLRTLDGVDHTLTPDNLVIADGKSPVALAGVMGGEESEISAATRDILLESAWFDPLSVRRTSKAQGMHTEASHRFERGADIEMAPVALNRTAELIAELAGGEILPGLLDVYPRRREPIKILFRASEIRRHLGAEIPADEVERILQALGFICGDASSRTDCHVEVPSFRVDVKCEIDLVEEIARIHGYDRLPSRVRTAPPRVERDTRREKELEITRVLTSLGYREIIATSMIDPAESARFTEGAPVMLENPLSQEASAMRASAVPGMLRALRWNLDRNQLDLRLFEVGKVYRARPAGATAASLPQERRLLTLGLSGRRRSPSIHEQDKERPLDFFDLKGDLKSFFQVFEISGLKFETGVGIAGVRYYDGVQAGRFVAERGSMVVFGLLGQDVAPDYKLRQQVWIAEIDLDGLLQYPLKTRSFRAFSKFPAVDRDFSLVLPASVKYAQLEQAVEALRLSEIQSFAPLDRLPSGSARGIPPDHYSLLLRVVFQSAERTLTSEEVDQLSRRLLAAFEPLAARLRS